MGPGPLVLAPMWMEWRPVRRALASAQRRGEVEVVRCGIALRRSVPAADRERPVITCGLAGGLRSDVQPGTVFVADAVAVEDGEPVACDPRWVERLVTGARACGQEPIVGRLLTARSLIVGEARRRWAERGFVAVDMETALLVPSGSPLASLRVVLDTGAAEVSERWETPGRSALDPRRWREALWLGRRAPAYAALAARCLGAAFADP
jgi:hypothetical protein